MIGMQMTKKKSIKSISTSTCNRNQDPDGKDEGLLGDQGGAEAKNPTTTRRRRNTIQNQTRQTRIGKPFQRQADKEQGHPRDVIRIKGVYNMPSAPAERRTGRRRRSRQNGT
jgi:hypothetical protein